MAIVAAKTEMNSKTSWFDPNEARIVPVDDHDTTVCHAIFIYIGLYSLIIFCVQYTHLVPPLHFEGTKQVSNERPETQDVRSSGRHASRTKRST